jgi:hypothetical protein
MQNSLKGNEAGMFLQDGKEMNYIIFDNRHTENIKHTGKKNIVYEKMTGNFLDTLIIVCYFSIV